MTSIERTAYPSLSAHKIISKKTLDTCYKLTQQEIEYICKNIRGDQQRFNFVIQLKTFQNLMYFIDGVRRSNPTFFTLKIKKFIDLIF